MQRVEFWRKSLETRDATLKHNVALLTRGEAGRHGGVDVKQFVLLLTQSA